MSEEGAGPLWRDRPGAEEILAAAPGAVAEAGDRIWVSPGLSNSYLIDTDDGAVVLNAGMGFEGGVHRENYRSVTTSPFRYLVLTQGHVDHVGGVDALRDPQTVVVAQANWADWRDDNRRLMPFRAGNAAFAWERAITAALAHAAEHARSSGTDFPAQSEPVPDLVVEETRVLELGGRRIELHAASGAETTDALIAWLPEERICFAGNLFGALFGHIPNLVTMRGDRYRDALQVARAFDQVRSLGAEVLFTGHHEPVRGAELIESEVRRLRDAVLWLHDATVDGMNAGKDVVELMATLELPPGLEVGQGYGKVAWDVRAIWENYAGWFHHRSTTELYPHRPETTLAELAALAGAERVLGAARDRLAAGDAVAAVGLVEAVLAAEPDHPGARGLGRDALGVLADRSVNFWESAWLRRERGRLA